MNCTEASESIVLRLYGGLPEAEGLDDHLAGCEPCARRAEHHARLWELSGLAVEEPLPPEAVRAVRAELAGRRPRAAGIAFRAAAIAAGAFLAWLALAPRGTTPQAMLCAPEDAPSAYVEPAFGELSVGEGQAGPLGLRAHRVTVRIDDWVARTEIEEVFFNNSDRRLEGTFQFPLPADASLSRFAMEVNGSLVEGELVERVRAREVYEGIVRRMQDPALLEWMPGNIFKARVFPIEPRSEKRIVLAYTQAPGIWNGSLRYVYPLVSEKTKACPPEELSVRVELGFAHEIRKLECPTHRVDVVRPDARSARAELRVRNARPAQDFQLKLELDAPEMELASHRPAGEDGYFGLAISPRGAAQEGKAGDHIFVIDRSARMGEKDLEVARRVVERMLERMGPDDRAAIVAHHVEAEATALLPVTPEHRRSWRDLLWELRSGGASDVVSALRTAGGIAPAGSTVVYVGKGVPTWGEEDLAQAALEGRTFRAVLVGSGTNREGLARIADGGVRAIVPGGDVEAEITAVARTVGFRPIRDLHVEVAGGDVREAFPARLPAVYAGERVYLFGRYRQSGPVEITVRGTGFERKLSATLAAGPTERGALPRLWAERALSGHVEDCRSKGEPRELVDRIVGLSRQYQVMTPYTSFLVLESEEAYKNYQIERARRREEEARQEEEQKRRLMETAKTAPRIPDPGQPLVVQAASPQLEKIIQEVARGRSPEDQARIAMSRSHYQIALTHHNRGEFEQARIEAQKAVEADHENVPARKLLSDIYQITVAGKAESGARSIAPDTANPFRIQVEQAQIEITKHVRDGERFYQARMYDEAIREFENADFKITNIPYEVKAMQELLPLVKDSILKARNAETIEERRVEEEKKRVSEAEAEALPSVSRPDGREWEELIRKLGPRPELASRGTSGTSEDHLRQAERLHQAGDYEAATRETERALQIDPTNQAARALQLENEFILGRGRVDSTSSQYDRFMREALVRHQQTLVEMDNLLASGRDLYRVGAYEHVERESRKILEYAKWMPTGVELETRRRQAQELLEHTRNARRQRDLDENKEPLQRIEENRSRDDGLQRVWPNREPQAEAQAHEVATKREVVRKMARLLELSYMAVEQKHYDRCMKLCDDLLEIDPHYVVARELREDVEKARHKEQDHSTLDRKVEEWKRLTDDDENAIIPWSQTVRFPSRDEWAEISKRLTESVVKHEGLSSTEEDPDILTINRKLDTMKIDLAFENAKLEDILAFIRDFSGLTIVVDAANVSRVDPNVRVTFHCKDTVIKSALRQLLAPWGLVVRVTEEKVVLLTQPKSSRNSMDPAGLPRAPGLGEDALRDIADHLNEIRGKLRTMR